MSGALASEPAAQQSGEVPERAPLAPTSEPPAQPPDPSLPALLTDQGAEEASKAPVAGRGPPALARTTGAAHSDATAAGPAPTGPGGCSAPLARAEATESTTSERTATAGLDESAQQSEETTLPSKHAGIGKKGVATPAQATDMGEYRARSAAAVDPCEAEFRQKVTPSLSSNPLPLAPPQDDGWADWTVAAAMTAMPQQNVRMESACQDRATPGLHVPAARAPEEARPSAPAQGSWPRLASIETWIAGLPDASSTGKARTAFTPSPAVSPPRTWQLMPSVGTWLVPHIAARCKQTRQVVSAPTGAALAVLELGSRLQKSPQVQGAPEELPPRVPAGGMPLSVVAEAGGSGAAADAPKTSLASTAQRALVQEESQESCGSGPAGAQLEVETWLQAPLVDSVPQTPTGVSSVIVAGGSPVVVACALQLPPAPCASRAAGAAQLPASLEVAGALLPGGVLGGAVALEPPRVSSATATCDAPASAAGAELVQPGSMGRAFPTPAGRDVQGGWEFLPSVGTWLARRPRAAGARAAAALCCGADRCAALVPPVRLAGAGAGPKAAVGDAVAEALLAFDPYAPSPDAPAACTHQPGLDVQEECRVA